ncbi:DUF6917 domain-containing protein [Pseudothermotoga thermarum]|uniref:DUF6917 domain-containing protein n=1 Tax=Pseudothermotoga thermarum DSM 5069 TaxID=688269 RepID=F7YTV3_9THEM|nr:hypothetical protein [Pseudothermotoga thermarum]AEH51399.1 hypothetical protein Theth_1335 [Pseudothermotoga thermarum DSM 5069]
MVEPYSSGLLKEDPYAKKVVIMARVVAVLRGKLENRKLSLIPMPSRALKRYEIHELIVTDEQEAAPGKEVNKIAYLAFVEILNPGVAVVGDKVILQDGKTVGRIAGFDETHMPNHENIVIKVEKRMSGEEMGINVDDLIIFLKE